MRRTTPAVGALAAAVMLVTAACSSGGSSGGDGGDDAAWALPDEDPTATVQVLGHQDAADLQPVFDAFSEAHPSITVEYEAVPFDQLNSVLDARIANKDGNPDVYWADQPRIPALSARGYAEDITEQFAPDAEAWDPAPLESSSFDGHQWAVPIANSTQLLYYNKDLLDAAGAEYPSAAVEDRMTWEEITERAGAAVDAGAQNGLLFGQVNRYYQLQPLPMSLGGSAGGTGEGNLTPDVTSDAWVEAMTWYGSLFADGLSPQGVAPEQSDAEFLTGNTAYMVQGPWLLPQLTEADFEWGVAAHPYFEGGDAVTPTGSWSLAMSPFSDDKEAAAVFMRWMSVEEGGGYAAYYASPELPANVEGKTQYFEREVFASPSGQDAVSIIDAETSTTAVPRLQTVGYVEFEEILGRAFSDVANGADPAGALASASSELETAWAQYR
ncbi:extracellular solute-binding protein family 1 [Beutenbergia cavernae DSM 12333]|uniref:Extracellular solute-binding protein family 1 n=1 Tax=Beutenbergia cavernae (strain ATCC BAA-8 / DSM 12333 / CCUG 43141 / JCM 11478 / NBRC 16432 / NCIMB 13614 / HKI 0122) TaxID=471853 RepID=C5BW83_BEUC1|nr:sugar ABC transporter substrate-binding protein [Beutenbergia cavernae]ACQ78541.1 extracellular solute-binding protein family 1 [Beutenbergia cavernae DSM 12333]